MLSNNVTLVGNLGSDVELHETKSDRTVANVNLAYNRSYTDRDGRRVEETHWFRLKAWGKIAENMAARLHRGSRVAVEGRLETSSYKDKDGNDRTATHVLVSYFQVIERPAATTTEEVAAEATPEGAPF